MASTYDKVIGVISKPPDRRNDFEVNNLLPWFRKKSELFGKLKTELLFDISKNLQFVTKNKDEVVIRQGDQGDCMYILLRGKVTIYILYASKLEGDDDKPNQPLLTAKGGESLRQQLGTFVVSLGAGAVFGEVALLKEDDCTRTASIITDETCDFVVIDRELYNRSVKDVLKKEFEEKTIFIATNPYFQLWAPKYKKQLAMALQKDTIPYEGTVVKQGEPLAAIYFILTGEMKVVMDPAAHKTQYAKLFAHDDNFIVNGDVHSKIPADEEEEGVEELLYKMSSGHSHEQMRSSPAMSSKLRRKPPKKQPQEVCLLGVNEAIGDIEVLLDQDTYMQTAISTQKTEVLVLEMKHYERLLVKRNPRTIEAMKSDLELRLKSRTSRHLEKHVPLLRCLLCKAEDYNQQKKQQSEARQGHHDKSGKQAKTLAASFDSFLPPRGPVIDERGPGTVWYRIRERSKAQALKKQSKRKMFGGYNSLAAANTVNQPRNPEPTQAPVMLPPMRARHQQQPVDFLTSDPVLSNLEDRMRQWLANEGNPRTQLRVARLQRGVVENDQVRKPGAKVLVRPKQHQVHYDDEAPPNESDKQSKEEDEDEYIHHGHAWQQKKVMVATTEKSRTYRPTNSLDKSTV